jgi:hypothetical protein
MGADSRIEWTALSFNPWPVTEARQLSVRRCLVTPATGPTVYIYAWGNNPKRRALKGRRCIVETRGSMGSVQVRFLDDDQREIVSRRALRIMRDAENETANA